MLKPLSQAINQFNIYSLIRFLIRPFLFSFVILILFSRVVSINISHDEYQFVASTQVFISQGQIPYLDYPFLHMPYQIVVNSIAVLFSDYHLFAIRSLNAFFFLVSILIVFFLVTHIYNSHSFILKYLAGTLSVMLFLFDPTLLGMDGRALNHAFPVLLSLLAYVTFQYWASNKQSVIPLLGCGFLIGLATGVRLSFAVLVIPFVIMLAFCPGLQPVTDLFKRISTFLVGLCLSLLPVGLLLINAPNEFFFGNYVYIKLNTIYRQEVLFQHSMTPVAKIQYFIANVLAHPGPIILYFGLLFSALYLFAKLIRRDSQNNGMLSLSVLTSLVLVGSGFAPTPLWPQYFFAPVPFLVIGLFTWIATIQKTNIKRLLFIGISAAAIIGFPFQLTGNQIDVLRNRSQWIPVQTHALAQQIHKTVNQGKVATLAPIYPLEAGLETYPSFIVGPFVWRTAPLLSAEGRANYQVTSFHELEGLLDADPPSAIITGLETDYGFDAYSFGLLEKPLIDYAVANGYEPYQKLKPDFWPTTITVWVKQP